MVCRFRASEGAARGRARLAEFLWRRSLVLCVVAAFAVVTQAPASAQGDGDWSPPSAVFEVQVGPRTYLQGTSLVADQTGAAHLAWLHVPDVNDESQNAIYYSRWNGEGWTDPVDIFVPGADLRLGYPVLVPAPDGRLHMFWTLGGYVWHSWAWADGAASVSAWEPPEAVVVTDAPTDAAMDAKLDGEGVFHIVYSERLGELRYIQSPDGGATWSVPVSVSSVTAETTTWKPRIAVSPGGRLHAVWTETFGGTDTLGVRYAQSEDGGRTWSAPLEFGSRYHADGNVLAGDDATVYLVWNGGIGAGGGRFFQWSGDGGLTWSQPIQFSSRAGMANNPSLAVDSSGQLHLITGDSSYVTWDGQVMSAPREFAPPETERSQLAIVTGNQVLAIWPLTAGKIEYAVRQLDIPAFPTRLPPAPTVTTVTMPPWSQALGVTAAAEPTGTAQATATGTELFSGPQGSPGFMPMVQPVLAGAGGAAVVIMAVGVFRHVRRGRR